MKKNAKYYQNIIFLNALTTGDIILFHQPFSILKPLSWLSWLIRKFTKDYYNHCAIVSRDPEGNRIIVEAVGRGVIQSPFQGYFHKYDCKIIRLNSLANDLKLTPEYLRERINKTIGIPYDYSSCLLFQLLRQLGENWNPDINLWIGRTGDKAAKRFYCSELVAFCLELSNWWLVSPDDLDRSELFKIIFQGITN